MENYFRLFSVQFLVSFSSVFNLTLSVYRHLEAVLFILESVDAMSRPIRQTC